MGKAQFRQMRVSSKGATTPVPTRRVGHAEPGRPLAGNGYKHPVIITTISVARTCAWLVGEVAGAWRKSDSDALDARGMWLAEIG